MYSVCMYGVHAYECEYGVIGCHVCALVFVGAEATGRIGQWFPICGSPPLWSQTIL